MGELIMLFRRLKIKLKFEQVFSQSYSLYNFIFYFFELYHLQFKSPSSMNNLLFNDSNEE